MEPAWDFPDTWLLHGLGLELGLSTIVCRDRLRRGSGSTRGFRYAVRYEVDGIQARHVLQVQEIDRMAFPLREQRDQNVLTADLVSAGLLHVNGSSLDDSLKSSGWLWIGAPL